MCRKRDGNAYVFPFICDVKYGFEHKVIQWSLVSTQWWWPTGGAVIKLLFELEVGHRDKQLTWVAYCPHSMSPACWGIHDSRTIWFWCEIDCRWNKELYRSTCFIWRWNGCMDLGCRWNLSFKSLLLWREAVWVSLRRSYVFMQTVSDIYIYLHIMYDVCITYLYQAWILVLAIYVKFVIWM